MPVARGEVNVYFARPRLDPAWPDLLDAVERSRLWAYRHDIDRARFLTGAVLVRRIYAADLGIGPGQVRLDRGCPRCGRPHGKLRLTGGHVSAIEVSVSHSGDWVVVAACRGYANGVDIERVDPGIDHAGLARLTLTNAEQAALGRLDEAARAAAFTRFWARKEALTKAIGAGLRAPLTEIEVSAPDEPARLRGWSSHPDLVGRTRLYDLQTDDGHRAALAVLRAPPMEVVCVDTRL